MRLNKALVAGMAVLALAACNKKQNNGAEPDLPQGNTYASLTIVRGELRADEADENGRNEESSVKKMMLLSAGSPREFTANDDPRFTQIGSLYKTDPFETEAGPQIFALVLNAGDVQLPTRAAAAEGFISSEEVTKFASDANGFVMTSKAKSCDVKKNIDLATVQNLQAPDEEKNGFEMDVERVVAQGIVVDGTGSTNGEVGTTQNDGKLSGLKYGGAMGAAKTYVFADNAGERKMGTANKYAKFKSVVDDVKTKKSSKAEDLEEAANKAARANFKLAEITDRALAKVATPFEKAGFYFFENSANEPNDPDNLGAHRNAYGKVYGVFTPTTIYDVEMKFVAGKTGKYFNTTTFEPAEGVTPDNLPTGVAEGKVVFARKKVEDFQSGNDFYLGAEDGLFYSTAKAAGAFNPGKGAYLYEKGKCVYRTPWNRVMDNGKTVYADTRRNNIYVITIKAFEKVGYNYDPNDPDDPNIKKPKNPIEPVTPPDGGDPSWEKDKGYVSFFSKVLPWNKVSREETLGK